MTRSRRLRLWTVALWGVCLLAATGDRLADSDRTAAPGIPPASAAIVSQTSDVAVLPGRVADELRAASQAAPLRTLALAAVMGALAGLPAALRGQTSAGGHSALPLRARRHTIAMRAPPLQFA